MPANHAIQRVTLLSFRTFGDYILKAPFLFELASRYPNAEITLLTNRKGGQVYTLLDSRLKVITVDHGDRKLKLLRTLLGVPPADLAWFELSDVARALAARIDGTKTLFEILESTATADRIPPRARWNREAQAGKPSSSAVMARRQACGNTGRTYVASFECEVEKNAATPSVHEASAGPRKSGPNGRRTARHIPARNGAVQVPNPN